MTQDEKAKWAPEAIAALSPQQIASMKQDKWVGTGFIVRVLEPRLFDKMGKEAGYNYLVTNRHVVQPGIEDGHPCRTISQSIVGNHKSPDGKLHMLPVSVPIAGTWEFPQDDAVDLAATNFLGDEKDWDFQVLDDSMFVTGAMLDHEDVAEGDPVLFAGLFVQYVGGSKLEPIVRSGIVAMLPRDLIDTTLKKPGHVVLAELHSFGGNSGSPVFAQVPVSRGSLAFNYKFLGVVAGEVYETNELTLQITTSYKGDIKANSNISMLVPAYELKALLAKPGFAQQRDAATETSLKAK